MKLKVINPRTIRYWTARLSASDPGLTHLERATRVTLSVISAVLIIDIMIRLGANVKITAAILAGVLALIGNLAVVDETIKEKKITTCLLALSSASAVTMGAGFLLIGYHIADVVLLGIVFLTFYLQRFGVRYFSLCMVGFISFYFSNMLGVKFSQLPWFFVAILTGVTVAFIFNFILFKERPEKVLKRTMSSYHIQINLMLNLIMDMVRDSNPNAKRIKSLDRNVTKLNEYARLVSSQFESTDPGKVWPGLTTNQLRLYVFDSAMLVETLSPTVKKLKDLQALRVNEVRDLLLQAVQSLREADVLREEYDSSSSLKEARQTAEQLKQQLDRLKANDADFKEWLYLLRRIESIINHVIREAEGIQRTRFRYLSQDESRIGSSEEESKQEDVEDDDDSEEDDKYRLRPSTQKAFQAGLAGALSIVVGYLLSPAHQYWVLLSSFVILFGTESVGRTIVKASQRFAGTLFGAIFGFGIAYLVNGQTYLEIVLLFFFIFMAFYLLSFSYAFMMFWITMLLALMYNLLLGGISEQLLLARVVDTLIGAALGATVTIFLFPHSTKDKIRDTMVEFLTDLKGYVDTHLNKFVGTETNKDLADEALDLDAKLQEIRDDADALKRSPGTLARSGIESRLTALTAVSYYAKHLIASTYREQRLGIDETVKQTLKQVEKDFDENIDTLCELLHGSVKKDVSVWELKNEREFVERAPDKKTAENFKQTQLIHDLYYVWRINRAIVQLAKDLGAAPKSREEQQSVS